MSSDVTQSVLFAVAKKPTASSLRTAPGAQGNPHVSTEMSKHPSSQFLLTPRPDRTHGKSLHSPFRPAATEAPSSSGFGSGHQGTAGGQEGSSTPLLLSSPPRGLRILQVQPDSSNMAPAALSGAFGVVISLCCVRDNLERSEKYKRTLYGTKRVLPLLQCGSEESSGIMQLISYFIQPFKH